MSYVGYNYIGSLSIATHAVSMRTGARARKRAVFVRHLRKISNLGKVRASDVQIEAVGSAHSTQRGEGQRWLCVSVSCGALPKSFFEMNVE